MCLIGNHEVVGDSLKSARKILPSMGEVDVGHIEKMLVHDPILLIVGIDTHKRKVVLRQALIRTLIEATRRLL